MFLVAVYVSDGCDGNFAFVWKCPRPEEGQRPKHNSCSKNAKCGQPSGAGLWSPECIKCDANAHAPKADKPNATVECIGIVAPRLWRVAAMAMPAVSASESAGTAIA